VEGERRKIVNTEIRKSGRRRFRQDLRSVEANKATTGVLYTKIIEIM
jgi:hypothetical protein